MELLVQMWCPFENSPMDRALYVWGCARSGCQAKAGSVRAWRGLRYNDQYAAKLAKKLAKTRAKEKPGTVEGKQTSNPFLLKNVSAASSPFGLGNQLFGSAAASHPPSAETEPEEDLSDAESDSASSDESLLTAMASASVEESPWRSAPSYPPIYLSTISEYIPPQQKRNLPVGVQVTDPSDEPDKKSDKNISWASESYENSSDVDRVFERFTKRVGYEGEQCVRYELKGTPLPFSSDEVFEALFPAPPAPLLPVTKPDFKVVHVPKRTYNPSIPPCPVCKSRRVFECQLMPNLINVLKSTREDTLKNLTDEERRKTFERLFKVRSGEEKWGMEWGTCLVFSCEKDCSVDDVGTETRESWREELVLVQWDV